jgi:uncharacterized membrane protein
MDSAKERELEARLSRIESSLTALQRSVDGLLGEKARGSAAAESARQAWSASPRAGARSRARATPADGVGTQLSEWFSSRSPEWWLSRLGVGFLVIAILFLYGYAIDNGWITPPLRVLAGAAVGAALFWAATRQQTNEKSEFYGLDLRQVLYGGALAIWYVTAYAAAVWYGMISITSARLLFFVLAIVSAWISLQERREVFAFIAVATGFATPFILSSPLTTLTPFALYLGTVSAIGLFIYLIRGWQSTIWMTFLAFWLILNGSVLSAGAVRSTSPGSITISVLIILAGAAFTRVASLRRQLLATGSPRYTAAPVSDASQRITEGLDGLSSALGGGKSAADSLALWVMTVLSPVLAVSSLANIWLRVPPEVAGLILVGLGSAAISVGMSVNADKEVRQVVFSAAAFWLLLGLLKIAPMPESVGVASLFAAGVIVYVRSSLIGPRTIAKVAIIISLAVVAGHALSSGVRGWLHWRWIVAELVTLGASAIVTRKLLADSRERMQGMVLGGLTYLGSLLVIIDVLEPIWPPLVTASYAVFGAALLIVSRRRGGEKLLRQMGGVTMLIVVVRLLLVDMASVDTIWRVLLFLVCGAVFLFAGYRLQPTRPSEAS